VLSRLLAGAGTVLLLLAEAAAPQCAAAARNTHGNTDNGARATAMCTE
jgi:hypothetical protein